MNSTRTSIIVITLLIAGTVAAIAGIPKTLNYQGYLKKGDGTPVHAPAPTGISMTFSFYSSNPPRNDNYVWRETQPNVPVSNGIYSTQLGSVVPISARFDVPYWLGIKVAGDAEMELQPFSSVPYALRAVSTSSVDDGAISTPAKLSFNCQEGAILTYKSGQWQCGTIAALPNGAGTCINGNCTLNACFTGFANCDNDHANGCESNITSSILNCGSCGILCGGTNATPACINGACQPLCNEGWSYCGNPPSAGCTVNLLSDPHNCGFCGNSCAAGEYCTKGVCGPCASLVINEFNVDPAFIQLVDYPGGNMGPMTVPSLQGFRYIELYNACPTESIDMGMWELQGHNGTPDNPWRTLVSLEGSIPPGSYRVYANSTFQPRDGTIGGSPSEKLVALRLTYPTKVGQRAEADFVTWIGYFPGYDHTKAINGLYTYNSNAWSRIPNGTNSGNNIVDFQSTEPSPGGQNHPLIDGLKNGTETDVDCGGFWLNPRCSFGRSCLQHSDCDEMCKAGVCVSSLCTAPLCIDGVKNGVETDVDCGGSQQIIDVGGVSTTILSPRCETGKHCLLNSDCLTGYCTNEICTVPSCTDGVKNGLETDTDCGGPTGCPRCSSDMHCLADSDCNQGSFILQPALFGTINTTPPLYCNAEICTIPTCMDWIKNQYETDVDCGGSCSARCEDGKNCSGNTDCWSKSCNNGICQAPNCSDGIKNGTETDIDCGGTCTNKCTINGLCSINSDCASNICTNGSCL